MTNSTDFSPRTCETCPHFQRFEGEPRGRGWCHLFDKSAKLHHQRTETCDLEEEMQQPTPAPLPKPEKPRSKTPRLVRHTPERVTLLDSSGWLVSSQEIYRQTAWQVVGRTGNIYSVVFDSRGAIACNCLGFSHHRKCYHSDAVKTEWRHLMEIRQLQRSKA